MCVCVCIYICICIYVYTHAHTQCMHTYIQACTHTHTHTHTDTHTHTHTRHLRPRKLIRNLGMLHVSHPRRLRAVYLLPTHGRRKRSGGDVCCAIYTHAIMHAHSLEYMYMYMYMHMYMHMCMYVIRIYVCMSNTHTHTCILAYIYIARHTYCPSKCLRRHACIHTPTPTHIHTDLPVADKILIFRIQLRSAAAQAQTRPPLWPRLLALIGP